MSKVSLQAVNIAALADGYAGRAIDQAIAEVVKDIGERGDDGKARTVNVKLTFTPDGKRQVEIDVQATHKVPAIRPPRTVARLGKRVGELEFNPDCSDNPDQLTMKLDDDE